MLYTPVNAAGFGGERMIPYEFATRKNLVDLRNNNEAVRILTLSCYIYYTIVLLVLKRLNINGCI